MAVLKQSESKQNKWYSLDISYKYKHYPKGSIYSTITPLVFHVEETFYIPHHVNTCS